MELPSTCGECRIAFLTILTLRFLKGQILRNFARIILICGAAMCSQSFMNEEKIRTYMEVLA